MPLRLCLDCGRRTSNTRCPGCTRRHELTGKRARRPDRTHAERLRRAAAVHAHLDRWGYICPGWQRPAHPAHDLTADHVLPVAAGGREDGPLTVLCRSCNGAKGARP